jgi:4-aminobutyrate aminotransferase-like enzyme
VTDVLDSAALERILARETPSTATTMAGETTVVWARASGTRVVADDGAEYIDLTAGSGVSSVGHCHPAVVAAIQEQAAQLLHTGWQYGCPPRAELLDRLVDSVPWPVDRAVLTVTGAEAVEAALKIAQLATGRRTVLSFEGGFHGKTSGALRLTAKRSLRRGLAGLPLDSLHLAYPDAVRCAACGGRRPCDLSCLARNVEFLEGGDFDMSDVAAVVVEPIQGASGAITPPPEFLPWLRDLCTRHGALLVADEIFTGLGRTGAMFACEWSGVAPDLLIVGKALGGGLPISGVVGPEEVMDALGSLRQTSTFSGQPLACAAGVAVLETIERERLAENAAVQGEALATRLAALDPDSVVRGRGLMLGVELLPDDWADGVAWAERAVAAAKAHGLLLLRGGRGNILKLTPPLTIDGETVDEVVERLGASLAETR